MTAGQPWPSARATLIVAMLLLSLASAGVLTWQAHDAATLHRAGAESVVRDYAALIADEAIRRISTEVGYSGDYTLIAALAQAAGQPAGLTDGTLAALRSAPDDRLR